MDQHGVAADHRQGVDRDQLPRLQRDLAVRLASATDLDQVGAAVRDAVAGLAGIDAAGVYAAQAAGGSLRLLAHHGVSVRYANLSREWRYDIESARRAMQGHSTAIEWPELAGHPELTEFRREGLRCEVVVPVEIGGEIVLVVVLASRHLDRIPTEVREAAETVAYVAGGSVGRVLADERRRRDERSGRELLQLEIRLAEALLAARFESEVFEQVVDTLWLADWVDSAAMFTVERAVGEIRLRVHRGGSAEFMASVARVPLDTAEAATVLGGTPLYTSVEDSRLSAAQDGLTDDGFRGRALVPVRVDGVVRALIAVASRSSDCCPPSLRGALESCALKVEAALLRIAAESALRDSEAVLRRAQRIAHSGSWRWEPDSGRVWWSEELYRIYGRDPASFEPDIGFLRELVHPEDREPDVHVLVSDGHEALSSGFEQRVLRPDGTVRRVRTQLETVLGDDGALRAVLGVVHDLTEQQRLEHALARRLRYERAIAMVARELLTGRDGVLERVLRELLVASDASRVYLFENYQHPADGPCTRQIAEVCAPGVASQRDNPGLQHCPWQGGGFERWPSLLADGEPVRGLVEHLPSSERAQLEPQGIVSLLVLPVFVDGRWWGFIGFDDTVLPRQWMDGDLLLLRTAADMVAAFLERQRDRLRLAERSRINAEAAYRLIARHLDEIVWTSDLELRFSYVSPASRTVLGFDDEQLLRTSLVETLGGEAVRELFRRLAKELAEEAAASPAGDDAERVVRLTLPVRCADGSPRTCEHIVAFRRDASGRPIGLIGVTRPAAVSDATDAGATPAPS